MKRVICIFLILILFTACSKKNPIPNKDQDAVVKNDKQVTLDIMATNKILYDIVKEIVKDKHYVDYMFKDDEEQWNFTFSNDSLNNISKQDLFIYMGASGEPWIDEFLDKLNKGKVGMINASRGVKIINYTTPIKYKDVEIKENPYYWMSPDNYRIMVLNIKNSIQDKDPQNRNYYEENFSEYIKKIENQEKEWKVITEKYKDYTFLLDEEDLEYYLKYNNFKSIKVPTNQVLDAEGEKKLKEAKNLIFLYTVPEKQKANEAFLTKYNIPSVQLFTYKKDINYIELLNYNINALKK